MPWECPQKRQKDKKKEKKKRISNVRHQTTDPGSLEITKQEKSKTKTKTKIKKVPTIIICKLQKIKVKTSGVARDWAVG